MRSARVAALVEYERNPVLCAGCHNPIPVQAHEQPSDIRYKRKFCNHACAARHTRNRLKDKPECRACGATLTAHRKKFCNNLCQGILFRKQFIKDWLGGKIKGTVNGLVSTLVKQYFLEKFNNQCQRCGWGEVNRHTGKVPLQLHHKDGDHDKDTVEDFELLCPNCHALTDTWGARNKGKGRLRGQVQHLPPMPNSRRAPRDAGKAAG